MNRQIAQILFNIATLLKRQEGNPYRIRNYRNAARAILRAQHSLAERAMAGQELGIPNLGESLTRKITALATTGHLDFYDELCSDLPLDQQRLLKVPGIGPILAERISKELGTTNLIELLREAARRRLEQIWGIGPARAGAIVEAAFPDDSPEPPPAAGAAAAAPRKDNIVYTQSTLWDYHLTKPAKAA
ncbi:MAG TPA: helix-hairpin-helix domain-containing protein [Herpetosiphonaceae bacterium]